MKLSKVLSTQFAVFAAALAFLLLGTFSAQAQMFGDTCYYPNDVVTVVYDTASNEVRVSNGNSHPEVVGYTNPVEPSYCTGTNCAYDDTVSTSHCERVKGIGYSAFSQHGGSSFLPGVRYMFCAMASTHTAWQCYFPLPPPDSLCCIEFVVPASGCPQVHIRSVKQNKSGGVDICWWGLDDYFADCYEIEIINTTDSDTTIVSNHNGCDFEYSSSTFDPDTDNLEVRVRAICPDCNGTPGPWSTVASYSPRIGSSVVNGAGLMQVMPNPNDGAFEVSYTSGIDGEAFVEIADVSGRTVYRTETSRILKGANTIAVNAKGDLGAGVYILKLHVPTESKIISRRVMLK